MNREDGAVEVVAEGETGSLEEFITQCHKGPDVSWIERVDVAWQEATGEFKEFQVLY
jgi:acylphosphatase